MVNCKGELITMTNLSVLEQLENDTRSVRLVHERNDVRVNEKSGRGQFRDSWAGGADLQVSTTVSAGVRSGTLSWTG